MKHHVIRLAVLSLLAVTSFGAAQVNGTVNGQTNVLVKLRGVLRLDVDVTNVVFDFTDTAARAQDSRTIDKAGELALGAFWDGAAATYMFSPTSLTGTGLNDNGTPADPTDDFSNDYGVATVTAGGNAEWTLKAKLDADFTTVPNTLKISTVAQKQKTTAVYTYATDAAISSAGATIAKAVKSAPANAGANGVSEMKLFFGYNLSLADALAYPTAVVENHNVVYSLTNP
jgi:hypothetical protein